MRERDRYMVCCDCGEPVKEKTMFIKKFQNTGFCLCKNCTLTLGREIEIFKAHFRRKK